MMNPICKDRKASMRFLITRWVWDSPSYWRNNKRFLVLSCIKVWQGRRFVEPCTKPNTSGECAGLAWECVRLRTSGGSSDIPIGSAKSKLLLIIVLMNSSFKGKYGSSPHTTPKLLWETRSWLRKNAFRHNKKGSWIVTLLMINF